MIAPTGRRAESLGPALEALLPGAEVMHFPAWETLPHERLSPSPETVGHRLDVLGRIARWTGRGPLVVTASVRGALQPLAAGLADAVEVHLAVGGRGHDLADVSARLVELAYHRVDMVSRRGEFAMRGGILDVFPPIADHPYRVEFFGDEVDQIRAFSVADQRSLPGEVPAVDLPASRELLLTQAVRDRARQLKDEFPGIRGMLEKMAEGIPAEGMESLIPALVDDIVTVVDYLPEGSAIALVDPERSVTRAITLLETNREFLEAAWSAATAGAASPVDLGSGDFVSLPRAARGRRRARHRVVDAQRVRFRVRRMPRPRASSTTRSRADTAIRVPGSSVPSFQGNVDGATAHVGELLADGWRVVVAASGAGLVERARDVLAERGHRGAAGRRRSWSRPSPASRTSCSRRSSADSRRRRPSSRCSPRPSSTAGRSAATSASSRSSPRAGATSSTRCS